MFEKNNQRIIQAQLFLSLNYIQKEVKDNDYTKDSLAIIIDEAHLLIDENNPIALDFVYQMVKRIRKRNGGIIIISQNPDMKLKDGSLAVGKKIMIDGQQRTTALMTAIVGTEIITENFTKRRHKISFNPLLPDNTEEERGTAEG